MNTTHNILFLHMQGVSVSAMLGLGITMWLLIGQTIYKPYPSYLETNVVNCTMNATDIIKIPRNPYVFSVFTC